MIPGRFISHIPLLLVCVLLGTLFCGVSDSQNHAAEATPRLADHQQPARVSFNKHIRPIFAKRCVGCHGGVQQLGGLSFIYRDKALAEGDSGEVAIVPGDAGQSELMHRVTESDPDLRMPPPDHGAALSKGEIALFQQWIAEGANWEEHWSLIAPDRVPEPLVKDSTWSRSKVDPFILNQLEAAGLKPSPEASKREWLRRVSFDLIGLPPTEDQTASFLADESPEAYRRVVDRLLESPHFGEHWAAMWLDLFRYADTQGYEADLHRTVWPYRDWLIRALNRDMPYDQFVIKQLAGDLVEDATIDDRLASAMHRNSLTATEGGTDDEEFRLKAIIDRVNTTWQVFGGLTFGCVQCHSHPYDPIEHDEYYQFLAFFNTTQDSDLYEEYPLLAVPKDEGDYQRAGELDETIRLALRERHAQISQLATEPEVWEPLSFIEATASGGLELDIRGTKGGMANELVAVGTPSTGLVYTLLATIPQGATELSAIRVEVLPRDNAEALKASELGVVVSQFDAWVESPDQTEPVKIPFSAVVGDEPQPLLSPDESLRPGAHGWGAYSRIDRPRWAVFLLEKPVHLPDGAKIKIVIQQQANAAGQKPLLMARGRFSVSADKRWEELLASEPWRQNNERLGQARAERDKIPSNRVPVMREQHEAVKRKTAVFLRGNWLAKGEVVGCDVPAVLPSLPARREPSRLDAAQWFVSPEHPLTSRVFVNRIWAQLFGRGIVETLGDFGVSGLPPTHPQLLDDMAVRFRTEMNWQSKALLRELVLSSTYRQTSKASADSVAADPENRFYSRGPRQRLSAEMVRDQGLVVSGKLSPKLFGPPVMPPQPDGIWRSVYNGSKWVTSKGDDRYRRALYTYWKRTSAYPSMIAFDAPTRAVCAVDREPTNTPLQALVTLNDPAFYDFAEGLATRIAGHDASLDEQLAWGYEVVTGEPPTAKIVAVLRKLYDDSLVEYDQTEQGESASDKARSHYAMSVVANTILNLDEAMTR